MMSDVTVSDGTIDLAMLFTHMNPLAAGAVMVWHSHDRLVFEAGTNRFVVTGTDLTWRDHGLQGGAADALTFRSQGVDMISFANLQTTGAALWAALQAEQSGSDPAALVHLLVHHCWTYRGSAGVDFFPETTLAPFGWLNPTGNDRVFLNSGDDVFFTGGANDTVNGDSGDDQISGGSDNDLLTGGSGNDSLYGNTEDDRLYGGSGRDYVSGGDGNDTVLGGGSDDRLRGGAGADVFVFAEGSGQDVIVEYQVGVDHLQVLGGLTVTISAQGANSLVQFGADTILMLGITVDQLTQADFL